LELNSVLNLQSVLNMGIHTILSTSLKKNYTNIAVAGESDFIKINCASLLRYFHISCNKWILLSLLWSTKSLFPRWNEMQNDCVAIHLFGISTAYYISAVCLPMVICL